MSIHIEELAFELEFTGSRTGLERTVRAALEVLARRLAAAPPTDVPRDLVIDELVLPPAALDGPDAVEQLAAALLDALTDRSNR